MSNMENPICQFENCKRIANYRKLRVGDCHLKDTKYEYCAHHRPKNSINKKFPYKTIFDKIDIELKYYNHSNEYILNEYHDHIYKLLKNHKFKFPIKITAFTENLVYDFNYIFPIERDINNMSNYEIYFDSNIVTAIDIYNIILEFKNYYNQKKIEMLYIHLNKDYEIDDIIKEFRNYYEQKKVNDIIEEFKDYYKKKKVKLDDIFNLIIEFREYYNQKKLT